MFLVTLSGRWTSRIFEHYFVSYVSSHPFSKETETGQAVANVRALTYCEIISSISYHISCEFYFFSLTFGAHLVFT